MTRSVVDTSALIALLYPNDEHNRPAAELLHEAAEEGALLVSPVVYAELAADPYFGTFEELDAFLDDTGIVLEDLTRKALFSAGDAFQSYLDRRGEELQCPACGTKATFECPGCGNEVRARQHIASDFLVGAHAESAGALLTFDEGFFRDYFDVECRAIREDA